MYRDHDIMLTFNSQVICLNIFVISFLQGRHRDPDLVFDQSHECVLTAWVAGGVGRATISRLDLGERRLRVVLTLSGE